MAKKVTQNKASLAQKTGKSLNFLILLLFGLIIVVAYYILKPSISKQLTKGPWCVDRVLLGGSVIGPKTLHGIYMISSGEKAQCFEHMEFNTNGDITLPGINTRSIDGSWKIAKDNTIKLSVDTLQDVFQGIYTVIITGDKLILKSKKTVIDAHR